MVGENNSLEKLKASFAGAFRDDKLDAFEEDIKEVTWSFVEVYPEEVTLARNIRDIEDESVLELAMSIKSTVQLQPCVGDIIDDGETQTIRLIAGQHRYHAIRYLCEIGYPTKILIRVANKEFTDEQLLSIQMSENSQNKMTPQQDAKQIHSFWRSVQEIYGEDNISISYLARKMGRSPRKVSDSIKYIEELSPKVQKMVDTGVLSYSTALLLAKLDKSGKNSKNVDYYSEQVRTAMFLISKSYTTKQAEKYIRIKSKENELAGPLFTNEVWEEIKTNGYKIAIKDQSSKEGRAAAGWFVRMNDAISILEQPHNAEFTEAIKKAMKELGVSLEQFYSNLEEMGVKFE